MRRRASSSDAMFGNEPAALGDVRSDKERLRFTLNTLARIRFVSAEGARVHGQGRRRRRAARLPPLVRRARAGAPRRADRLRPLVLARPARPPDLLGLDTGCAWGGTLTAVRIDGTAREIFQVRCGPEPSSPCTRPHPRRRLRDVGWPACRIASFLCVVGARVARWATTGRRWQQRARAGLLCLLACVVPLQCAAALVRASAGPSHSAPGCASAEAVAVLHDFRRHGAAASWSPSDWTKSRVTASRHDHATRRRRAPPPPRGRARGHERRRTPVVDRATRTRSAAAAPLRVPADPGASLDGTRFDRAACAGPRPRSGSRRCASTRRLNVRPGPARSDSPAAEPARAGAGMPM
jgi:hypothetical protein